MGLYERDYYQDENELQPVQRWDRRSVVTTLIVINVAVFVANFVFGSGVTDPVNEYLWLHASDLTHPAQWYRFLTNGFVHSRDVTHILFNMLSLYLLGQVVEIRYGRGEFLRFYLIAVVLCSLGWAVKQRLTLPVELLEFRGLLGASGAVTGITMLFVFNFPKATLLAFGVLPIKAWMYGIFVVVMNVLGTSSFQFGTEKQVAYDVHLIGAGFAAVYYYSGLNFGALGTFWSKIGGLFSSKPKLKIHDPARSNESKSMDSIPEKMQAEADRILDKLHREGQDSLTAHERKVLEDYSRAVRKARQR